MFPPAADRRPTAARRRRPGAALRVAALAGLVLAQPAAAAGWSPAEVQAETADAPPGWQCQQSVVSPDGHARLAVCRGSAPSAPASLALLLTDTRVATPPVVLARLGDASAVALHAFSPARPCNGPASRCLAGLLLVDQRDEGGCFGTEVYVWTGDRRPKSLGFIDESGPDAACLGAAVTVDAGARGAVLRLAGPLSRMGRDGVARPVAASAVEYEVVPGAPRLQRRVRP